MPAPEDLFSHAEALGLGEIHLFCEAATGLHAIIAIHSTRLGPALGGCRFIGYPDFDAAVIDAMRLARGMSYKAAIARLPYGGGKSVIVRPEAEFDREALFESFGGCVESLGGRYVTAEDSGTGVADMDVIARVTRHVTGTSPARGGTGDPSPHTAFGVRRGIEAAARVVLGREDLRGLHVAIQGVGHVGWHLARELHAPGARLTVTDVDGAAVRRCVAELGAQAVPQDAIYAVECDVFAPCALGAVIDDRTLPRLAARIVAGAANNQLAEPRHGRELHARGITYVPDYVINAGGLMHVVSGREGYRPEQMHEKVSGIHDTVLELLERAQRQGLPSSDVAEHIGEELLGR